VNGLGVWSFILATFVSGVVGLVFMYHSAPWPIRLCFDRAEMRRVLKHGVSFQSASIVNVISQWATPAIVGTMLGPNAVGYLGLALANAHRPLLVAESVMRVSFPHFSRLQGAIKKLHDTISDYLLGFLWVMVLWTAFLWTCGSPLVAILYSPKWLPAVPALVIFALALPLDMIIWAIALGYRATDRNWGALRIFCTRTALNLALAALLVPRIGFIGIPWAYLVANLVSAVLFLCGFAPGFFARMVRSGWWLVPCGVSGYVCGRLSAELLVPGVNAPLIQQLLAGAVPFMAAYLLTSLILAPKHYRDVLLDSARNIVFSGRQTGSKVKDVFGKVPRTYSIVPRPESLGCAASED
jgi:O-antigen/teichoic acid export membrane protein